MQLANERRRENDLVQSRATFLPPAEEDEEEENTLFSRLVAERAFQDLVGLPPLVVEDIYRDAQSQFAEARRRGPRPKLSWLDHIVVLLILYKLGLTVGGLARRLGYKESTVADAVVRIQPIVNQTLWNRWWNSRQRPKIYQQNGIDMWLCWVTAPR